MNPQRALREGGGELKIAGGGLNEERPSVEERKNGDEERVPTTTELLYKEGCQPR
jgi:hypothetical protein